MYEEPDEHPQERPTDPTQKAREKADELRINAEICAIFEGPQKFDAELQFAGDDLARDVQRRIARLEKQKLFESPILPPAAAKESAELLAMPESKELSTSDYHTLRRPGELMMIRWLRGEEVDMFYERMQAHLDVALGEFKQEERDALEWKKDEQTLAYLDALDKIEVKTADRYLRDLIRRHNLFVLSTITADEMDILHLCDFVMGMPAADVVGAASAPPTEDPTEQDRAWFFRMFSLRGVVEGVERMCFFTYMQKAEDTFESE